MSGTATDDAAFEGLVMLAKQLGAVHLVVYTLDHRIKAGDVPQDLVDRRGLCVAHYEDVRGKFLAEARRLVDAGRGRGLRGEAVPVDRGADVTGSDGVDAVVGEERPEGDPVGGQ